MDITIAHVTPPEIPQLLELIRELARFEKLEAEVEATPELLRRALHDPQPSARALFVHCNGEVAGYAIYYFTFSSFTGRQGIWLEDIYVRPPFRQRGLARRLIAAVARIGYEHDCGRMEWTALKWNEPALALYARLGARVMDEWVLLRCHPAELRLPV